MQDIPQNTLNETTKTEQSARIDCEIDLTALVASVTIFQMKRTRRASRSPGRAGSMTFTRYREPDSTL
jgi:phage-related protein